MNKLFIMGHLTADATVRTVNVAGVPTPVATFTVAANYGRRNENGDRNVQFVRCTAWREFASKLAPYLKKGTQVAVEGPCRVSVYQSNQDRTWRGQLEIPTIESFEFLSAQKRDEAAEPAEAPAPETPAAPAADDGYPFD